MFFFSIRREWYSYHFPELVKIVNDNSTYCKVAQLVKNRKEFTEDKYAELEEIVMDEAKVKAICDAAKSSMGAFHLMTDFFKSFQSLSMTDLEFPNSGYYMYVLLNIYCLGKTN